MRAVGLRASRQRVEVAGFPTQFIEELKYKCDIVSVISQYVPLTKKGNKYFCCCPFHNEKTASMCVNTDGQYYHCFGCNASGDVITFIMEIESVSYPDAVKILAEKAGLALPEYTGGGDFAKKKKKQDVLKQLMRDAALYYHANLKRENEGREARQYLASRGLDEQTAVRFGMGLSLGYDQLQGYMRRKGYSAENLRECGLVNGERLSDAFAGRIIVPIMNGMGDVIAFGGRIYRGEKDVAKYKNSTNTVLFDKGRCVYGINFVKKEKKQNGSLPFVILVEGYMDVISLAAAGIGNAVAGMGTALTPYQAREIKRLTDTVYVCYDGDAAGRKAAMRNVEPLIAEGLEVKVMALDEGADPDDTVRKEGKEGFDARRAAALPVLEYKLKLCENAYGLDSATGRARYVSAALKVLKDVENTAEREVYLGIVSDKSGVSVETLKSEIAGKSARPVVARPSAPVGEKEKKSVRAARFVLNKLLDNKVFADVGALCDEWFSLQAHRDILAFVRSQPRGEIVAGKLFSADDTDKEELNRILDAEGTFDSDLKEKAYYVDCVNVLANEFISSQLETMTAAYKQLTDAGERREMLLKIRDLQIKLKSSDPADKL